MLTKRKKAFIKAYPKAKNGAEAARIAGYSPKRAGQTAYELLRDKELQDKIQRLGDVGLDTLEEVALNGKVEIARVQAGKTLVETAYGKPKDNPTNRIGNVTINVKQLSGETLNRVIDSSVKHTQSQPLVN